MVVATASRVAVRCLEEFICVVERAQYYVLGALRLGLGNAQK